MGDKCFALICLHLLLQRPDGRHFSSSSSPGVDRKVRHRGGADWVFVLTIAFSSRSAETGLHTGRRPVLCEALTQPFEVMPAKKFPGMLDPTPLSQAFAKQGLRIPTVSRMLRSRDIREGVELTWSSGGFSGKGRTGSGARQTRTRRERDCREAQEQNRYRFRQGVWGRGATERTVRQPRCRRRISTRRIKKTVRLRETHTGRFRPDLRLMSIVTAIVQ